jgi:outer membrane protein assembly factor BamA
VNLGVKALFLILFLTAGKTMPVYSQDTDSNELHWTIDSISIRKNWRTKERIILQELGIKKGDALSQTQIEASITKIWNIGNFAKVNYQIDTLEDKKILLTINAQDALTLMPILSFNGNKEEFTLIVGIADNNLLGRNIDLNFSGVYGTNVRNLNVGIGIPRQLLYRNMTVSGGFMIGQASNYRYIEDTIFSGIGTRQKSANLHIGNPFHTDNYYSFSPDLGIGYYNQKTDSTLLKEGVNNDGHYNLDYITIGTGESIGILNRVRHQQSGYQVSVGFGYGISLNKENPGYFSVGFGALVSKIFRKIFQFDANFSTGYTTAKLPSQINYLGPGQVKGILTGERSGQAIWSANTDIKITYINRDWFATEQSFFINAGNSNDIYWEIYNQKPLYSLGSQLRVMIPMIPWLAINFYYAWVEKNWFSVDF